MEPIAKRFRNMAASSLLLGLVGAFTWTACSPHAAFFCTDDAQCRRDGAVGSCEAVGFCSFPDDTCPSGHRFGELAQDGFASRCVAPDGETGDGAAAWGSTGDSELDPTTTAAETMPSTGTDGPTPEGDSTGGAPWASTGDLPGGSSDDDDDGESSDGDMGCGFTFVDEFEGAVIDPAWTQTKPMGAVITQHAGQLELGLPPSPSSHIIVTRKLAQTLTGGYVRVRLSEIAAPHTSASSGVVAGVSSCDLQLYAHEGMLRAVRFLSGVGSVQVGSMNLSGEFPQWFQLRQDEAGTMHFEWSLDEVEWIEVASGDFPECGDITKPPNVGVFAGGSATVAVTRRIDEIAVCAPSGS
jgi:hypothetical protein